MNDSDALLERIDGLDMRGDAAKSPTTPGSPRLGTGDQGANGAVSAGASRYVHLDPATFSDDRPQKFTHSLRGHPLMTLPSFVELARRRPKSRVRIYNAASVTAGERLEGVAEKHASERSFDEMVADIEQNKTYLFIQNVETDAIYAPFVRELLEDVKIALRARGRKMVCGWGWVFISAPGTVSPYHRDHEQTCLLQLTGNKTVSVFPTNDREICSEEENEFFHTQASLQKTVFNESMQPRASTFELGPGDALYMPFSAPHWVQNGPATSMSFSVTYATEDTMSLERAYRMNAFLRKAGLRPKPVGDSSARDAIKQQAWRLVHQARRLLRRDRSTAARY
jgi:hypothetical protein